MLLCQVFHELLTPFAYVTSVNVCGVRYRSFSLLFCTEMMKILADSVSGLSSGICPAIGLFTTFGDCKIQVRAELNESRNMLGHHARDEDRSHCAKLRTGIGLFVYRTIFHARTIITWRDGTRISDWTTSTTNIFIHQTYCQRTRDYGCGQNSLESWCDQRLVSSKCHLGVRSRMDLWTYVTKINVIICLYDYLSM